MGANLSSIEEVFVEALDLPIGDRAAFVERRCHGDPALGERVQRLLAAHDQTVQGFLDPPTVGMRGPAARARLRPAQKLGRYAVLHELGHGGMGVVYAAYDEQLQRRVAVKRVRGDPAIGDAGQRLKLEAMALARLQHPNVVAVHDVGDEDGELFLAMELVDGEPLSKWAQTRSTSEVLRALLAAGRGLAHAHREGILHRDFKPANVLVDKSGRARVADFGLAADHDLAARDNSPMGTPGFMAPEIHNSEGASVASDVYAYCRTLSELVGSRPDAPHWVAPLVERGLSPAATDRWPQMDPLLDLVDRELHADPLVDPRRGRQYRRAFFAAFSVLVVAFPAIVFGGNLKNLSLENAFYMSLLPAVLLAAVLAAFWRPMTATDFNRRGMLTLLGMMVAVCAHRGMSVVIHGDVKRDFLEDLLLIAAFLFASRIYDRTLGYFHAAAWTFALGAGAVAFFPDHAPLIFGVTTVVTLPFAYLEWAAKGRTER